MSNELAILTCVYNESACLNIFADRIRPVLDSISADVQPRVIFINNGSDDDSLEKIQRIIDTDSRFNVLTLSRNFGYQGALVAGLTEIQSDLYCIVDVDCEDPPEVLIQFIDQYRKGAHIIYGIRSVRNEPFWLTWFRKQFYRWNKILADTEIVVWMSEFALFTKAIRNDILRSQTTFPFLRNELAFVGYPRVGIPYKREKRAAGKTHYNFFGLIKFAIVGILAGTTLPLRLPLYAAPFFLAAFVAALTAKPEVAFIADVSVILLFLYTILTIPFVSIYLARTYKNVTARPLYILDRTRSQAKELRS